MPPVTAETESAFRDLWVWRLRQPAEFETWRAGLPPDQRREVDALLATYADYRAAKVNVAPFQGVGVPAADTRSALDALGRAGRWVHGKAGEAVRGVERATGLDIPGVGLRRTGAGRPGPGFPLPGTPEQRGAGEAFSDKALSMALLNFISPETLEKWGKQVPRFSPDRPAVRPTGEALEQVRTAGDVTGMVPWLSPASTGGVIAGVGTLGERVIPQAAPKIARTLGRYGAEGALFGTGHAAGALQEGATPAEAAKTAGQIALAWTVAGPVLNAILGKAMQGLAGKRAKAQFEGYVSGLERQQGRAPSPGEAKAAAERIGWRLLGRRPKPTPEPTAESLLEEGVPEWAVDMMLKEARAKAKPPRIMEPTAEETAALAISAEAKAAPFREPVKPKPPKPPPTEAERMSLEADARSEAAIRAKLQGLPEKEVERAISEAEVPRAAAPAQKPVPEPPAAPEAAARAEAPQVLPAEPVPATRPLTQADLKRPGATTTEDIENLVMSPRVQQRETGMEAGVLNRGRVQEIVEKWDADLYTAPTVVTPENPAEFAPFYKVPRTPGEPLVEVPLSEVGGKKVIDVGHHRTTALAWKGEAKVSVRDAGTANLERAQTINAVEQLASKDLNPLERARSWRMLADRGATHEQLAGGNFTADHVQQHIDMLNIPSEDVLADVATGQMNWRVAAGMGRAIRDQGAEIFDPQAAQGLAGELKRAGFQGEGPAYNFVTSVAEAAKKLQRAGEVPAGGVAGVQGGQGTLLDVPQTLNVSRGLAELVAESREQASIARLARRMSKEKPGGKLSALEDVSELKLEADVAAAEARVAEIDKALAESAAGDRVAQDELIRMMGAEKPAPPTGARLFEAGTGEKAVPFSEPKPPGWTRTGGGRRRGGVGPLPDTPEVLRHGVGSANRNFSSTGALMESTGPTGTAAVENVNEAYFLWRNAMGKAGVQLHNAMRGLPNLRLKQGKAAMQRVFRYLDGRIGTLRAPGEKRAAKDMRAVLDELEIAGLEDGILTIRARQDFHLPDGRLVPKTAEGPQSWSNMRLAKGRYKTTREVMSAREVDIEFVNPETADLLPGVYSIPAERLYLPARANYFPRRIDPKWFRTKQSRAALEKALQNAGMDEATAADIVTAWRHTQFDPWEGAFRLPRLPDDLPEKFYMPPREALAEYLEGATRHIAWGRQMGQGTSLLKEGWLFERQANDAMAEGVESWVAKGWARDSAEARHMLLGSDPSKPQGFFSDWVDAVRMDFGRMPEQDARRKLGEMFQGIRSFTSVISLPRVLLTNISQHANTGIFAGYRNMSENMVRAFNGLTREEAATVGALSRHGLEAVLGISGKAWHQRLANWMVTKGYGLGPMENWLRTTAALASRKHAVDSFARLQRNPGDAWAREALQILRVNPQRALQRGHLTDAELDRAMFWGAAETQFLSRYTDLPTWYTMEWGRTLAQFLGFAYQQGKFVQRMWKRDIGTKDPGKMLKFAAGIGIAMPIAGETTLGVKAWMEQKPRTGWSQERLFNDLAAGGGLGLAYEMLWDSFFASDHGDMFAGAALGQLGEAWGNVNEVLGLTDFREAGRAVPRTEKQAERDERRARLWFKRRAPIPYGGARTYVNMFEPPPGQAWVPHWLRAQDVGQSIFKPRSESYNIWELNTRWDQMKDEQKQQRWWALSPGDRVNLFIKLNPDDRWSLLNKLGLAGQERLVGEAQVLGPKAVERALWAYDNALEHKRTQAAERAAARIQP